MLTITSSVSPASTYPHRFDVISYSFLPFLLTLTSSTRVSVSVGPYATTTLSVLASHAVAVMLLTA